MVKQGKEESSQSTTSTTVETFKLSEDQQAFKAIADITGDVYDLLTEIGQRKFITNYNRWVALGKPRPKMVEFGTPKEAPIPIKLYLEKVKGKMKFYWRDSEGVMHGKRVEKIEEQKKDADNVPYVQRREVTHYETDFKADEAKQVLDDSLMRSEHGTHCYFVLYTKKVAVQPDEFLTEYDNKMQPPRSEKAISQQKLS